MGVDQYHEPAEELSQEMRTFARMVASLIEEAEAIGWYEQRMSLEKNKEAKAIMANAQKEEFKHFGMNLEFLLRRKADWRVALQGILFKDGDIVEHGEQAEKLASMDPTPVMATALVLEYFPARWVSVRIKKIRPDRKSSALSCQNRKGFNQDGFASSLRSCRANRSPSRADFRQSHIFSTLGASDCKPTGRASELIEIRKHDDLWTIHCRSLRFGTAARLCCAP